MTPDEIAAPADPTMKPGGTYMDPRSPADELVDDATADMPEGEFIGRMGMPAPQLAPQQQPTPQPAPQPRPSVPTFSDEMTKASRGRASDVNDFMLTMDGIANGDPIGMETFDLGFYEDGTPAIVINGSPVPIRHEQWMALASQRSKMREEIRQRIEFEAAVNQAQTSIGKVIASVPQMPAALGDMLMSLSTVDPGKALDYLYKSFTSVQANGGKSMMGEIAFDMQQTKNEATFGPLLREGDKTTKLEPNPFNPAGPPIEVTVPGKTRRDMAIEALRSSNNPDAQYALLAYAKLEDFALDPNLRKIAPTQQFGIFNRIVMMEADKAGPMSLFNRLRHIAAVGEQDFGMSVPLREPTYVSGASSTWAQSPQGQQFSQMQQIAYPAATSMFGSSGGGGANQFWRDADFAAYRAYLSNLDQWAANAFGYDLSTPDVLDAMAEAMMTVAFPSPVDASGSAEVVESVSPKRPSAVRP